MTHIIEIKSGAEVIDAATGKTRTIRNKRIVRGYLNPHSHCMEFLFCGFRSYVMDSNDYTIISVL